MGLQGRFLWIVLGCWDTEGSRTGCSILVNIQTWTSEMTWQLRLYLRVVTCSLSLFLTSYHPHPPFPRRPLSIWEDPKEWRGLPQSTRCTSMKHVGAGRGADSPGILAFRLSQMLPVWLGWCQGWWVWHRWQEQRLVRGTDEQMQHVKQRNTQSRDSGMNITSLQIVSFKKKSHDNTCPQRWWHSSDIYSRKFSSRNLANEVYTVGYKVPGASSYMATWNSSSKDYYSWHVSLYSEEKVVEISEERAPELWLHLPTCFRGENAVLYSIGMVWFIVMLSTQSSH